MTDEKPADDVVAALLRVVRDLPGIGKDSTAAPQQGGYAYRGIESITQHTQPLFARHGVLFTPHVRDWEIREIVVNGKPWTDTVELVEYTVYGPGGRDDHIIVGPILAIGRDNSDKGANKCMTQAYKYALLQALAISDAKDDGDQASHEAEHRQADPPISADDRAEIDRLIEALSDSGKARLKDLWKKRRIPAWKNCTASHLDAVHELLVDAETDDEPASTPDQKAMRQLFALLNENGIDDDLRHDWATNQLGREVTSFSELSDDDVAKLTDVLRGGRHKGAA